MTIFGNPSPVHTHHSVFGYVRDFINRKTGVESDELSVGQLGELPFEELDTGSVYYVEGSDVVMKQGPEKPEILLNKILFAEDNNILNKIDDTPFNPNLQKKGWVIPAATAQDSVNGILEGVTMFNPYSILPTDDGYLVNFRSKVDDDKLGFSSPVPICRRGDGYEIRGIFKNAKVERMLIGFASSAAFSMYSNVFWNNDIGIAIGFTDATTNFCIFTNSGDGTPAIPIPFSLPKDEELHEIEMKLSSDGVICRLDSEEITVTSDLPSLSTNLYLHVYGVY